MTNDQVKAGLIGVISLIVVFAVVVMAVVMLGAAKGSVYTIMEPKINDMYSSQVKVNFTFTASNTSMVSLGNILLLNGTLTIQNKTFKSSDANANYTVNYNNGSLKLRPGGFLGRMSNTKKYNATYTYKNQTILRTVRSGIISSFDADKTMQDYTPIIGITFMAIVLLTLVVSLFLGRGLLGKAGGGNVT